MYYKTIEVNSKLTQKLRSKNIVKIKATIEVTIRINMPQYVTREGQRGYLALENHKNEMVKNKKI